MNNPIVLVIHGMGSHAPGEMKRLVNEGINEAAANFGLNNFSIESEVEFYQFNYSVFLDEIRQRDADYASGIAGHLSALQGHGLGESMTSKLTEFFADFGEDEALYTHWMDVVYYGLMFWGEKIRVDLAKKINDIMIEANAGERDVHIIAHSLGTAVLHDTLAKIFRKDVDITSKVPGLDVDRFTISSIWSVANVSRLLYLLNDISDPNHSVVNADIDGCCDYFVNVRNRFDPFTWIKQYNRDAGNYRLLEVDAVRKMDTHDIREYMANPFVSSYFLNHVLGTELTQEQWDSGLAKHSETTINKPFDEIKNSLENISNAPDINDKISALEAYFTLLKKFREKLESFRED